MITIAWTIFTVAVLLDPRKPDWNSFDKFILGRTIMFTFGLVMMLICTAFELPR